MAYKRARKEASQETGLPIRIFPEASPFSIEETTDESFWPESAYEE